MLHADTTHTRTLTVVLSEAEWRALRDIEPDAVGWIQQQVRQRLALPERVRPSGPASRPAYSDEDEY
ncbi:MAG TPA: hypothetical protein VM364_10340 [Vicinamibacterales bacterium]|nr:hypothetical protein [Vicinamibacterales bacterium]